MAGRGGGSANARTVVAMYGPEAAEYERIWAVELLPFGRSLVERLELRGARRILEVGCGVGLLLPDIGRAAGPGAFVVGADLTFDMVWRAPASFGRVAMDCQRPAFAEGVFDAAIAPFVLFHLTDPLEGLRGLHRVLRPGGGFGSATFAQRRPPDAVKVLTEVLDAFGAADDPARSGVPDGEALVNSPEKMAEILGAAGFVDVDARTEVWERTWSLEEFMRWRSSIGPTHRRLRSLAGADRERCLAAVRSRLGAVPADAFVGRDQVILTTAHRYG